MPLDDKQVPEKPEVEDVADENDLSFLNAEDDPNDFLPEAPAKPPEAPATAPDASAVPPAAAEPTPPAPPARPRGLVNAARRLGISEERIAALSDTALDDLVDSVLEVKVAQPPAPPPTEKPIASVTDEDDDVLLDQLEKEIEPDPRLMKLMRKQSKKIKELENVGVKVKEIEQRDLDRAKRIGIDAVESGFASLPPEYEQVFGKGAMDDIKDQEIKDSRYGVYALAGVDFQKDTPTVIQQKIVAVAKRMYGKVVKKAEPAPKAPAEPPPAPKGKYTADEAARAALGRPAGKVSKRERALADTVKEYMAEHGIFNGDGADKDEFPGVPD